jgi:hypothetical protein
MRPAEWFSHSQDPDRGSSRPRSRASAARRSICLPLSTCYTSHAQFQPRSVRLYEHVKGRCGCKAIRSSLRKVWRRIRRSLQGLQLLHVQFGLLATPNLARFCNIGPILLGGALRLFFERQVETAQPFPAAAAHLSPNLAWNRRSALDDDGLVFTKEGPMEIRGAPWRRRKV